MVFRNGTRVLRSFESLPYSENRLFIGETGRVRRPEHPGQESATKWLRTILSYALFTLLHNACGQGHL